MNKIIDSIVSPNELKNLTEQELKVLAGEIREEIIDVVSKNGGHLASNLGVVELTLALHRVFSSPSDKIIWDVGHQAYVHKIVTGRLNDFKTLRQLNGISGFPKRAESDHDIFDTGHSSNSISAALGLVCARDLSGEHYNVVAVIGDGAMTGGMAFEAMNHAGDVKSSLIVILNDNQMSISKNTGSLSVHLNRLRTAPSYFRLKSQIDKTLHRIPIIGKGIFKIADRVKDTFKYLLVPGVMFEELGFKYLGPIDGHDIKTLEETMRRAKSYKNTPVLVHVVTKKGKGYSFAEERPNKYHGVGAFDKATGESVGKSSGKSFSQIAGDTLIELAKEDSRVVAVTAAMPDGTGLSKFAQKFPNRFYDVGIAEQHAVTFSSGLALGGYKPFFFVYSTFLQRAYDQILEDASIQKLNIVFCIDRAGLVGNDGETHHGVFDISYLSAMPNLTILSPRDGSELSAMLSFAKDCNGPVAIRYARSNENNPITEVTPLILGKSEVLSEGRDGIIFAEGKMVNKALKASELLKESGFDVGVVNVRFIKPLDITLIRKCFAAYKRVYTIEDGIAAGGLGNNICQACLSNKIAMNDKLCTFAYEDFFVSHGTVEELYSVTHMDITSIYNKIYSDLTDHGI